MYVLRTSVCVPSRYFPQCRIAIPATRHGLCLCASLSLSLSALHGLSFFVLHHTCTAVGGFGCLRSCNGWRGARSVLSFASCVVLFSWTPLSMPSPRKSRVPLKARLHYGAIHTHTHTTCHLFIPLSLRCVAKVVSSLPLPSSPSLFYFVNIARNSRPSPLSRFFLLLAVLHP